MATYTMDNIKLPNGDICKIQQDFTPISWSDYENLPSDKKNSNTPFFINNAPVSESPIIGEASGSIATFDDGSANPIKELTAQITAVQSGSGDPSPENVRPISGWDGANVGVYGKNFCNKKTFADWTAIGRYYLVLKNQFPQNTRMVMSLTDKDTSIDVSDVSFGFVDSNYSSGSLSINQFRWIVSNGTAQTINNNTPSSGDDNIYLDGLLIYPQTEEAYNKIFARYNVQVEIGTTPTSYVPYNTNSHTYNIAFTDGTNPLIVYGGNFKLFKSGGKWYITVNSCPYFASYNGETLVGEWISDRDVYAVGTTPTIGAQVVNIGGEVTTTTFEIDTEIATLLGNNNIFADCGDVDVKYIKNTDPQIRVNDKIYSSGYYSVEAEKVNGHTVETDVPRGALFTDTQANWAQTTTTALDYIKNKPTLGTASAKDIPSSGNASSTQVVMGNDTRLSDSRTPTSHTHGNIQNGGTLQTTDITIASGDKLVVTDSSNSNKIARTSTSFSAAVSSQTQSTKFLREDGTMAAPSYSVTYKEVTQAEYDLLPSSKLTDGVLYCIKDGSGGGGSGSGGGINYSTTEQDTGLTWIDGRPIYQKTCFFNTVGQGVSLLDSGFTATLYDHVWQTDIHWRYDSINIDIGNHGGTGGAIFIESYNNQGLYAVNSTGVDITDLYFTIRYTKTADL